MRGINDLFEINLPVFVEAFLLSLQNAVAKRFTPSCVARFNQDAKKDQKFQEIKAKDAWDGQKYVEEQGWATLPGEERPDSKVAEGCAKSIMEAKL